MKMAHVLILFLLCMFLIESCGPPPPSSSPPPFVRKTIKIPDPIKTKKCRGDGKYNLCRGNQDCEDICGDIFKRTDREHCYKLPENLVYDFKELLKNTEKGNFDKVDLFVLECLLDIDEREFAQSVSNMSRRDAEEFITLITEDDRLAEILEDEDNDFNVLRELLYRAIRSKDIEDHLSDELLSDKSFLWLAGEANEFAWKYLDNYVSEECDRGKCDENIEAYCKALLTMSVRDLEDFLSDADLFADEYQDTVEDAGYEYEESDFRDYCEGIIPEPTVIDPLTGENCNRSEAVKTTILMEIKRTTRQTLDWSDLNSDHIRHIISLDVYDKNLTEVKECDFSGLRQLKTLSLVKNKLTVLPDDMLDGLTELEQVDFAQNQLTSLSGDLFDDTPNMKLIKISYNQLASLPNGWLDGLTKMYRLDLNHNDLEDLPDDLFDSSTSFTEIHLHNNNLTSLSDDVLADLHAQGSKLTLRLNSNNFSESEKTRIRNTVTSATITGI